MRTNAMIIAALAAILVLAGCESQPQNNMKYRALGNTGLQVSEIGLGCGGFSHMTAEEARAFMDRAIDAGCNYIDLYDADPTVRDNIGEGIRGRRSKMMVQGHIGSFWKDGHYARTRDVEEARIGFEDMLERLGTDCIEVGMIHITDTPEQWLEIQGSPFWDYILQLKEEGKIKHIGVSSHNAQVALMAAKSGMVEVIMFSLNPAFDRLQAGSNVWDPNSYEHMLAGVDPVRVELYDYCATHGIAITAMKVFGGGGHLLKAESSPLKVAFTPVQCIAYSLSKPCVASALVGAGNIEELEADLAYLEATDEEKDWNQVMSNTGKALSGDCTYCNHCSPCPHGIEIAVINELLDKAAEEGATSELRAHYDELQHHASECTECGSCASRCPFDVDVPSRMKKAVEVFGH